MRQDPLDTIISLIQSYVRDNVNTVLPAKVVAVNKFSSDQTVDVNIQLSRLYTNGDVVPNTDNIIYGVPVVFPSAGGAMLSFPIAVGDTVLLLFSQRCLDEWLLSNGDREVIPGDSRHYSKTDAIAIPGLYTTKSNLSPSSTDVQLKFGNSLISISPSNVITINNGSSSISMSGDTVTITASTINADVSSFLLNGKELVDHTHSGVTSGGSNTGPNN